MNKSKLTDIKVYSFFGFIILSVVPIFFLDLWITEIYSSALFSIYSVSVVIIMLVLLIKSLKKDKRSVFIFLLITVFMLLLGINTIKNLISITKDVVAGPETIQLKNCNIVSNKNYGSHSYFSDYHLEGVDSSGKSWNLETDFYSIPKNSTVEIKYFKNNLIVKELKIIEENNQFSIDSFREQSQELDERFEQIFNTTTAQ